MKCKYCGAEITGDSAFCTKCGKPVETLDVATERLNEALSNVVQGARQEGQQSKTSPSGGGEKPKGLLAPLITLAVAVGGWLCVWFTNTIEGAKAWFTSSQDMQGSLSGEYNYYGNGGSDELTGVIVGIIVIALLSVLAVVGLIWFGKRLYRKFVPKKK